MSLSQVFNTDILQNFKARLENQARLCLAGEELALNVLHRGMLARGQDPSLSNYANEAGLNLALLYDLINEGVTHMGIPVVACLEVTRRIMSPETPPYSMFA